MRINFTFRGCQYFVTYSRRSEKYRCPYTNKEHVELSDAIREECTLCVIECDDDPEQYKVEILAAIHSVNNHTI